MKDVNEVIRHYRVIIKELDEIDKCLRESLESVSIMQEWFHNACILYPRIIELEKTASNPSVLPSGEIQRLKLLISTLKGEMIDHRYMMEKMISAAQGLSGRMNEAAEHARRINSELGEISGGQTTKS